MTDALNQTTIPLVSDVLDNPCRFANWWNRRAEPEDRAIINEAVSRGLIVRSGGLLCLTMLGKDRMKAAP